MCVAVCHIYMHNSNVAFQTQSNVCEAVRVGVLPPKSLVVLVTGAF